MAKRAGATQGECFRCMAAVIVSRLLILLSGPAYTFSRARRPVCARWIVVEMLLLLRVPLARSLRQVVTQGVDDKLSAPFPSPDLLLVASWCNKLRQNKSSADVSYHWRVANEVWLVDLTLLGAGVVKMLLNSHVAVTLPGRQCTLLVRLCEACRADQLYNTLTRVSMATSRLRC